MTSTPAFFLAAALLASAAPVHAQSAPAAAPGASAIAPSPAYAEGEVRKLDRAAGKITLRHGEIRNIDMPPMTMVFAVRDKAMLDRLKPGDKVRFEAIDDGGTLTVVTLELLK